MSQTDKYQELVAVRAANDALNGSTYPADSLHARGYLSPSCHLCREVARLEYECGLRATPHITTEELDCQRQKAIEGPEAYFEKLYFEEARVNNWRPTSAFKPTRRKEDRFRY